MNQDNAVAEEVCANCTHVRTFKPRDDERERFGFGQIGYGCNRPNWEGYTKAGSTCEAFAALKARRVDEGGVS